ncbi:ctenidin-3-like [Capsicum annuum]|uniref:ctenidin-3-like n=1 Tax=Capsicum annuum TaxID=4072 RepID=UPI001FB11033|nr:ctenidin-3-like [Capsicum annuum]
MEVPYVEAELEDANIIRDCSKGTPIPNRPDRESVLVRGVIVDISGRTINRMLFGPGYEAPPAVPDFDGGVGGLGSCIGDVGGRSIIGRLGGIGGGLGSLDGTGGCVGGFSGGIGGIGGGVSGLSGIIGYLGGLTSGVGGLSGGVGGLSGCIISVGGSSGGLSGIFAGIAGPFIATGSSTWGMYRLKGVKRWMKFGSTIAAWQFVLA